MDGIHPLRLQLLQFERFRVIVATNETSGKNLLMFEKFEVFVAIIPPT